MTAPRLTWHLSEDGQTLCALGELDYPEKPAFKEALTAHLVGPHRADCPHVDLTGVFYLDSAGLEALLVGHRSLAPGEKPLSVRMTEGSQPAKVMRLSQFHTIYRIDFVPKAEISKETP